MKAHVEGTTYTGKFPQNCELSFFGPKTFVMFISDVL